MSVTAATRDLVVILWGHDSRFHEIEHTDMRIQHETTDKDASKIHGKEGHNKLQSKDASGNNNSPLLELKGPIDPACMNSDCNGFQDFEEPLKAGHLTTLEHGVYLLSSVIIVEIVLDIFQVIVQVMNKEDYADHCHELDSDGYPVDDEDSTAKVTATVATQGVTVDGIVGKAVFAGCCCVEGHGHGSCHRSRVVCSVGWVIGHACGNSVRRVRSWDNGIVSCGCGNRH